MPTTLSPSSPSSPYSYISDAQTLSTAKPKPISRLQKGVDRAVYRWNVMLGLYVLDSVEKIVANVLIGLIIVMLGFGCWKLALSLYKNGRLLLALMK
ncbi:hypothetical protein SAICODRAFT_63221 [Saitoella complicata NRRL Y-17804]|nr:uncharacterized protein SAICODRAFT_63221 [Saitoella complicata NRRL Y-17804]ODQ56149.1 hypothetical protein SAICODRAFT_63221 [Saitoella complicata NRRL Y-17804]